MKEIVGYRLYPEGETYSGPVGYGKEVWKAQYDFPLIDEARAFAEDLLAKVDVMVDAVPLEAFVWYDPASGLLEYLVYATSIEAIQTQSEYEILFDPVSVITALKGLILAIAVILIAISFFQISSAVSTSSSRGDWGWVPMLALLIGGGYLLAQISGAFKTERYGFH